MLAQVRQDVGTDHAFVVFGYPWPQARQVLFPEALDQRSHVGRLALGPLVGDGIAAAVDFALEPLGFLARLRRVPIAECADGVATLSAAVGRVRQDEGFVASGRDADTEAGRPVLSALRG